MPISDLQPKQGNVELTAEVISKEEPRSFNKFGKEGKVCNAQIKDDSGEMKLTLWNEQIDQVNEGDKIKVTNGYVNEWQGEKQLTTGRAGKLEVLEKASQPVYTNAPEEIEKAKKEILPEEPINDEEDISEL